MNQYTKIAKSLIAFLKSNSDNTTEPPEGLCPNCWGREEYGGKFFERVKNHGFDINSSNPEVGWINDYVEKHLAPIVLFKEDDKHYCSRCKLSFHVEK